MNTILTILAILVLGYVAWCVLYLLMVAAGIVERETEAHESTRDPEGGTVGKMLNWDKREVRKTAVGWNPDPQGNGYTAEKINKRRDPSIPEYYKVVRKGKK
jgi:hypothetical protein